MTDSYDAIVVGGGHNGLVCAAYLAKAGLDVLVLERRDQVGGACITEELFPGYRFSACSYYCYLLQTKVIEDLELRRHGFHVTPLDPLKCCLFPDGRALLTWDSVERTQDAIGRFSKRDAEAYPRWVAFWERAAGFLYPYFLTAPPTLAELAAGLRTSEDRAFFDRLLTASVEDVVTDFFEDEAVRGAFIHAHDAGDVTAPGSAWAFTYIRSSALTPRENTGIVRGGMGSITQAMAAAARSYGATIQTSVTVSEIMVERGGAIGVRLADGGEIRARAVASNADPKRTFADLVSPDHLPVEFRRSVGRLKTNAAYFKFHAALSRLPDLSRYFDGDLDVRYLGYTKISPSVAYFKQSWDDARHGWPPRGPVLDIQIPSGYDSTMAPPGRHVMSIWASYAPVRLAEGTWDERRGEAGEHLIDVLAGYAPDIRDCLIDWQLFTPHDLETRVGLTDGNIRHLDIVPSQLLASRPIPGWAHYRTPLRGLYLCGAGTHPGGEVTGAPGHNAANTILADLA
ncbi:MAG TPA: NAD(P)/FAD-dependent oxidoreductase [bacterium]|nr:NAD(P)/FAD-dependent oxidoreductase [bacterium]